MFEDPRPKKITLEEWSRQFRDFDDALIKKFRYYHNSEWGTYLSPPATFMVYGLRELKRLKFDNSLAALRMWGFVFNETERLFRARQNGKKVVATMGDLGIVPVIVLGFPDCIPFYPECIWWTPFLKESTELFDCAHNLGIPEAACFSKAVLPAFDKKAYFPAPALVVASTGATCDDYSAIMQRVADLGFEPLWLELPLRRKAQSYFADTSYHHRFNAYLVGEYQRLWRRLADLTGTSPPDRLPASIQKANRLRALVGEIKTVSAAARRAPLPGLELMTLEFGSLYGYGDFDEWLDIVAMLSDTVKRRVETRTGVLDDDAIPIAWITPSADPVLLNLVEDLGARIVETEYVINQTLVPIDEALEPFSALAQAFFQASLIGSTAERIKRIRQSVDTGKIAGVLVTNMLGASHCSMETGLINRLLDAVPVLTLDVPAPFGITEQTKTRLAAFVETIKNKGKQDDRFRQTPA